MRRISAAKAKAKALRAEWEAVVAEEKAKALRAAATKAAEEAEAATKAAEEAEAAATVLIESNTPRPRTRAKAAAESSSKSQKTTSGSLVIVGKTPKVHRRSDHTDNPHQQTLSGSLVKVGKRTKVHQRSNYKQQTLSGSPITARKTPKLEVELPLHLLVSMILTRLPVKTLSRFRCVSKPLRSLISEPHLQKEHAQRCQQIPLLLIAKAENTVVRFSTYTIHGEQMLKDFSISFAQPLARHFPRRNHTNLPLVTFSLVQSCLGLVCLRTSFDGAILVFNPSTEEVITLPERPRQQHDECVGFGYTDFSDEFKVVRYFNRELDVAKVDNSNSDHLAIPNCECLSEVFTLGSSDGWRETRSPPPFKPNERSHLPLVHGALHFLPSLFYHRNTRDDHYISAFDVHTEQYRRIPLPKLYFGFGARANAHQCVMAELRGSLCMSFPFFLSMKFLQLWFLIDYNGGKWVKEYSVDLSFQPALYTTFAVTCDDCILLSFDSPEGHELCYYNTKKNCIEKTLGTKCYGMFYVDSFLPLPLK